LLVDRKAEIVIPVETVPVSVRDPKDDIVLATALTGEADFLVTGDVDLLVLNGHPAFGDLRIVVVREFLAVLSASS